MAAQNKGSYKLKYLVNFDHPDGSTSWDHIN